MSKVQFELKENPAKQITKNTERVYHSNLNRVAKALGIITDDALIARAREVIKWLDEQKYTPQQNKIFLSAVFYAVNRPEFSDIQRKLFIDKFAQAKNLQIGALEDDEISTAAKEKVLISKTLQDENIKQEIKNLEAAARIAKKNLADAKRAAKQIL